MAKKGQSKGSTKGSNKGQSADKKPIVEGKATEATKKKKTSPIEFVQQVRSEASKVTWTSRNETMVSTIMVLIMVAIMAIFFFLVDQVLRFGICSILPINCVAP